MRSIIMIAMLLVFSACSSQLDQVQDTTPSTVQAESFELTDPEGNVRAALEFVDGSPRFVLNGPQAQKRVQIGLDKNGNPSVTLFDDSGSRRVGLEFANGINPALFLRDEGGRLKAGMQVQDGGVPLLFMRNSALEDGFAVTLVEHDLPVMALGDPAGNKRVFIGLEQAGFSGSLVFIAADGSVKSLVR